MLASIARPIGSRHALTDPIIRCTNSLIHPHAGFSPEVHEQAMKPLAEVIGLPPMEYLTTRNLDASAQDRAAELNAALSDPEMGVLATVGGEDQITVVPHLDPAMVRADPKPFLGDSDNTNLLN
jgi:LD-carboxypeptidase N-terminal domain